VTDDTLQLRRGNTLAYKVYEMVKDRILSGELAPGARLKDDELARTFGVSNTPVREAMGELEKDGLIETISYRGRFVKKMSIEETREVYDVRMALEGLAARLAVKRITESQLEEMQEAVEEFEIAFEADDITAGLEADLAFHDLIVQASGNSTLVQIVSDLANRIQVLRQVDGGKMRRKQSLEDHEAILQAVKERDGEKAESQICRHIAKGKENVIKLLTADEAK
jgi:DNA-binding GntR family transcriptional regulator